MSRRQTLALLSIAAGLLLLNGPPVRHSILEPEKEAAGGPYPSDWFGLQRAFPGTRIPQEKFRAAVDEVRFERLNSALSTSATTSLIWTLAGPVNIGGRVTALAVVPGAGTVYLGSANGGVFKSTNSGVNWTPIFDSFGIYSIGALALDPTDSQVLYAGTGEANSSVDSYDGAGVFRTADGGQSWQSLGLEATARIARIAVDPEDPDRIFVAAMGTQFSTGPDRGLYRSEDGGQSWSPVLFVSDSTGAADVAINPAHPETVYCATWERIRRYTYRRAYGPECGIWRSVDHGTSWTLLSNGLPAPSDNVGRIGLAIAPSNPSTIYAQIITGASGGYAGLGLYRSTDGGASWQRRDNSGFTGSFGGFGWYFGDVAVSPADPDRVFSLGVSLIRSDDGGVNFSNTTGSAHVDQHAIWIDPSDPQRIYLGNDGGFFWSLNGGVGWSKSFDLPITQFYAGTIDPSNPLRLLGGTQDNNSLITAVPGSPSNWQAILGGDGFYCLVDPTNPSVLFAEYQFASGGRGPYRSPNGVNFIPPSGFVPLSDTERYNWNAPFAMDPNDHNVLLAASQRVYRSTDNGVTYSPISGNLTTRVSDPFNFGTVSTLAISPAGSGIYYAGTDDGKVWRSPDAGANWFDISAGLPVRWVTRVTPDPADPLAVYVTLSGFGQDEHLPHVYRSIDAGVTWSSISGNLPDVPANDVLVDPTDTQTLYLATDVGVFATRNLGSFWFPLGTGMPVQTVFDLTLHSSSRTLVAATHGRSQWKLDLTDLPVAVAVVPAPARLALTAPTPNPSAASARLVLEVSSATAVDIAVYDVAGRRVRSLLERSMPPGRHPLSWDGTDARGRRVGAGVYFVRASAPGAAAVRRLVRIE